MKTTAGKSRVIGKTVKAFIAVFMTFAILMLSVVSASAGFKITDIFSIGTTATSSTAKYGYVANSSLWTMLGIKNPNRNCISVIDCATHKVAGTIDVDVPYSPVANADGTRVYVAETGTQTVAVIDTSVNEVIKRYSMSISIVGLALTTDEQFLLVTTSADSTSEAGTIRKLNLETGDISEPITVGTVPERVIIPTNSNKAYVVNMSNSITIIDVDEWTILGELALESSAFTLESSSDGSKLYASLFMKNQVAVIDTATDTVTATIETGLVPIGVTVSSDDKLLYVSNMLGMKIQCFSLEDYSLVSEKIVLGFPGQIYLSPDETEVYVLYSIGRTVQILKADGLSTITRFNTGAPNTMVFA